ncbi:ATP-binding cassette domain-containing protein [Streptomyces sp. NPDC057580]|uniref:ATP-binding cassette domain-containing protein n=1 Tax=Streptomyces sp. NPDC057580 TaxID=3346173 RepID=UPI0036D07E7F
MAGAGRDVVSRSHRFEVRNLHKHYGTTAALRGASLALTAGEPHALLGHNGSGKSTLIKILSGAVRADAGDIMAWGKETTPALAHTFSGIAVIHQDLALVDNMTALENFGANSSFGRRRLFAPIRWAQERALFTRHAASLGQSGLDMHERVGNLSASQKANLAIIRALRQLDEAGSTRRLLVLDEPTVYLHGSEKRRLSETIAALADRRVGVLLVTHELGYAADVCRSYTVLRNGETVHSGDTSDVTKAQLAEIMVGHSLGSFYPKRSRPSGSEGRIEIRGALTCRGGKDQGITIQPGEILGLHGLGGSGHEDIPERVADALHGSNQIRLVLEDSRGTSKLGAGDVGIVPADRATKALWSAGTVTENHTITSLSRHGRFGLLNPRRLRHATTTAIQQHSIVASGPEATVTSLSGGNQQKVVMARALAGEIRLLVLHEPIQGVDVAAAEGLLLEVAAAASQGIAVLVCSNDAELLANLCDAVVVFVDGRPVTRISDASLSERSLSLACQAA